MTILKILKEPDPILRKKSKEVDKVDDQARLLMDNMIETMYQAPGIGLAASQVGILKRIIVIDLSKDDEKKILFLLLTQKLFGSQKKEAREKKVVYHCQDILQRLLDQANVN